MSTMATCSIIKRHKHVKYKEKENIEVKVCDNGYNILLHLVGSLKMVQFSGSQSFYMNFLCLDIIFQFTRHQAVKKIIGSQ